MKTTDPFKKQIQDYLNNQALSDTELKSKLSSEKKNIDDCITYILNQVQKSGCNGFADDEIYGMALHYYDEENIDIGKKINAKVVVNHTDNSDKGKAYKIKAEELKKLNQNLKEEPNKEMQDNWKLDIENLEKNPSKYWNEFSLETFKNEKDTYDKISFMQTYYKEQTVTKIVKKPVKKTVKKAVSKPKMEVVTSQKSTFKSPPNLQVKADKKGQTSLF